MWCTNLSLGDKDCDVVTLAGRNGKVSNTFDSKLVPDGAKIVAVVELHLVGDNASAELLVRGVLQIPACLGLLNKPPYGLFLGPFGDIFHGSPDLQVLGCIASFVFRRTLPGAQEGSVGRKGDIVDVRNGYRGQNMTNGCIDDADTFARHPGQISTAGRVDTAPQISFGINESRERLVDRLGVGDTDSLLGSVSKLQWIRHD